jgi:predicted secreted protein
MKTGFLRLVIVELAILTLFLMLTACNSRSPTQTTTASPPTTNTTSPVITGSTTADVSSDANSWNLDYATIKYDAQGNQLWVARYNGPGNAYDKATAIAVDDKGDTYVTGSSMGSDNGTSNDFATIKYDPDGHQIWVARYHGPGYGDSIANAMVIDKSGNVYVTGGSSGADNLEECTTIKYDSNGNELWIVRHGEPGGIAQSDAMAIDTSGNIYITGLSVDKNTVYYATTIKYDSNGHQIWAVRHSQDDGAWAIALGGSGNVYVAGYKISIKYDASGKEIWTILKGARVIATDNENNVYLLGTAKYDTKGTQLWAAAYPQENWGNKYQNPTGLAVDESGNVYVSGWSEGSRASGMGGYLFDFTTIKYDSTGNQLWTARYGEPATGENSGYALALDSSGNIYVTGSSGFLGDGSDYATVKYDSDGNQIWAERYHGPGKGSDEAQAIVVDKEGNIYVTGQSAASGVAKMTQSPYPNVPVYADTSQTIQIKVGDELAFGFDTFTPGGLTWNENHDDTRLSLVDEEGISLQPNYPSNDNTWFLFKALKAGQTQITFTYSGAGGPTNEQKVFKINIE